MRKKLKSEQKFDSLVHWSDTRGACYFDLGGDAPPPPDYTPLATASKESAEIMSKLGYAQMDEARRQYDQSMEVAKPVVDEQLDIMRQSKAQGDDYYNYMRSRQRPVEDALNAESMRDTSAIDAAERSGIMNRVLSNADIDAAERGLITGGDTGVYNARRGDIESAVGRAVSDARTGQTQAVNQAIRQAMRYGMSPARIAATLGTGSIAAGSAQASAANAARREGIDRNRAMLGQSYGMRNQTNADVLRGLESGRTMRQQDDARGWAKKLDVAGLYRGLPGASQGAYGLASQTGSSSINSQMAPGNALLGGMAQGAGMVGQGQGMQLQGLGNILSNQTSYANSANSAPSKAAGLGSLLGGVAAMYGVVKK